MAINKKIWLNWEIPKPCPTCNLGTLNIPKNGGKLKDETEDSKEMNSQQAYPYTDYIFSVHLKCNHCNDTVTASGLISEGNYPSDEEGTIEKIIIPYSFYPAPKIIHIPDSCPKDVKKVLNESFALYWIDVSSCANKIRISVEVLLNELKVPLAHNLHTRLEDYEKINPEISKLLMAIKWIGNAGSHFTGIENKDVLDAYELLEFALEKLYNDREKKIVALSEEINKANKKPKK